MKSEKNTGLTMAAARHNDPPGGSLLGHVWAAIGVTIVLGIVCCAIYPAVIWSIGHVFFRWQAYGSLVDKNGKPTTDDTQAVGSALIGQPFSAAGYFRPRPSAAGAGYDATSSGGTNLGPLSDQFINGLTTAATTQPEGVASNGDGIRFRVINYAVSNSIPFNVYHAGYVKTKHDDGSETVALVKEDVISRFDGNKWSVWSDGALGKTLVNSDGSLNETAWIDAFPHPTLGNDAPDYTRQVIIAADFATLVPGDAVTASGSGLDPHISPDNAALQKARVAKARNISPEQVQQVIDAHTDKPSLGFLGDPGVNVLMVNLALDAKYPIPAPPAPAPATQPAPTTAPATTQPAK